MIKKKKIAILVVLLCALVCFNVFALTPLGNYSKLMSFALSSVGFLLLGTYYRQFPKKLRIFGLLFILIYSMSILSTNFVHGQSIPSGIVASADIYFVGIGFLVYYVIMHYQIKLEEIKSIILRTAWIIFVIYIALYAFDIEFTSSSGEDTFGLGALRKNWLNFAAFIYMAKFFKENKSKFLAFSLILFSINHLVDIQRYILLMYLICLMFMIFQFARKAVVMKVGIALLILIPLFTLVVTATGVGLAIQEKFSDAMELLDEDKEELSDASIEVRFLQTEAAVSSIVKYPITGVGVIRNSEVERIVGLSHFYVSDIGVIGILFSFGIIGLIVFIIQIRYLVWGFIKKRASKIQSVIEFKYYLLYIILHALMSGLTMNTPGVFIMMVALIEVGRTRYEQNAINDKT